MVCTGAAVPAGVREKTMELFDKTDLAGAIDPALQPMKARQRNRQTWPERGQRLSMRKTLVGIED